MLEIKMAYYRKEDWERFISIIDDKESVHSSWYEWHEEFNKSKQDFEKIGFTVHKTILDLDKLIDYCKKLKLKNTGKTRSQFIQQA
jgi:hypothetical protein